MTKDLRSPNQIAISDGMKLAWKRRRRETAEQSEAQLHRAVAAFLRLALKPPTTWTTMPAGGGGRVRGAQLKAMGLQPGWPDILVLHPAGYSHRGAIVVGLELKTAKGRLSDAQNAMDSEFFCAGAYYRVARSVEEVEGFLKGVGIPLHATTMRAAAA